MTDLEASAYLLPRATFRCLSGGLDLSTVHRTSTSVHRSRVERVEQTNHVLTSVASEVAVAASQRSERFAPLALSV
jgi:hypothetical protein